MPILLGALAGAGGSSKKRISRSPFEGVCTRSLPIAIKLPRTKQLWITAFSKCGEMLGVPTGSGARQREPRSHGLFAHDCVAHLIALDVLALERPVPALLVAGRRSRAFAPYR